MNGLFLHCGAHAATLQEVEAVPVPEPTKSHVPYAHGVFVNEVRNALLHNGVRIVEEAYGLSHEGARMFALLHVEGFGLSEVDGAAVTVGLRGSFDMRFSAALALGCKVLVCDNLSFYGEHVFARKNTLNIYRDMPGLIMQAVGRLGVWSKQQHDTIEAYRGAVLDDLNAHDLMIEMVRRQVIPPSHLRPVIDGWHQDNADRSVWGLFNNVTEALRGTVVLPELMKRTERLHGIADLVVARCRERVVGFAQ